MRYPRKDIPSSMKVEELAGGILREALGLSDHGPKCTARTLLLVLFFAAARVTSIFDACRRLVAAPCDQTIRNVLAAWMPTMPDLERRLNQGLRAKLTRGLKRRARAMALDVTQIGYYGQPWKELRELRRGKRRNGTTRFHCYATLYVVHHGQRLTVAMTYVWQHDSMAEVVQRLVEQARAAGLKIKYLLLDRGFYGLDVVQYLKSAHCPFLMPVVHRGRRSRRPLSQLQGTRRFLAWAKSGWSTHVMRNRRTQTTVSIGVFCPPPRGRRKSKPRVFAFWGLRPGSIAWVARTYRTRYGIETSYRQMNQGRVRTCTRDPRLRLLLVGVALVLRNVWVWLHYMVLARMRGQSLQIQLQQLRLRTMLLMLQRCAEAILNCNENAQNPDPPPLGLPVRSH